jgi:hypothetical protein
MVDFFELGDYTSDGEVLIPTGGGMCRSEGIINFAFALSYIRITGKSPSTGL